MAAPSPSPSPVRARPGQPLLLVSTRSPALPALTRGRCPWLPGPPAPHCPFLPLTHPPAPPWGRACRCPATHPLACVREPGPSKSPPDHQVPETERTGRACIVSSPQLALGTRTPHAVSRQHNGRASEGQARSGGSSGGLTAQVHLQALLRDGGEAESRGGGDRTYWSSPCARTHGTWGRVSGDDSTASGEGGAAPAPLPWASQRLHPGLHAISSGTRVSICLAGPRRAPSRRSSRCGGRPRWPGARAGAGAG